MKALLAVALLAGPGHWHPTSVKPQCLAMSASAVDAALCLSGQRFAVVKPSAFLMPSIVATYFSGGSIGPTILPSATAPAATNAYVNYDGTNVVVNAPTGKGFAYAVNGANQFTVSNTGTGVFNGSVGSSDTGFFPGNHANVFLSSTNASHTGLLAMSNVADGATAIGTTINNGVTFATAGAKLESIQNNGTERFGFKPDSGLVFSTTAVPASTDTGISANGAGLDLIYNAGASNRSHDFRLAGSSVLVAQAVVANSTLGGGGQVLVSHIAGGSGAPTSPTAGTGCGTSSLATNAGSDSFGKVGVTCGTAGTTTNPYVTITFAHAYNTAPYCTISPANAATQGGLVSSDEIPVTTTTTLAINCGGGTCTTGTLLWNYHCGQ